MLRVYTIEGTYRSSREDDPLRFKDEVRARCAEQAFIVWERKHTEKPLLRFETIEPLI